MSCHGFTTGTRPELAKCNRAPTHWAGQGDWRASRTTCHTGTGRCHRARPWLSRKALHNHEVRACTRRTELLVKLTGSWSPLAAFGFHRRALDAHLGGLLGEAVMREWHRQSMPHRYSITQREDTKTKVLPSAPSLENVGFKGARGTGCHGQALQLGAALPEELGILSRPILGVAAVCMPGVGMALSRGSSTNARPKRPKTLSSMNRPVLTGPTRARDTTAARALGQH